MEQKLSSEKLNSIISFLTRVEIFQDLSYPQLRTLCSNMTLISLKGGEILIKEKDPGDCLFIVVYGRLRVYKEGEPSKKIEEKNLGEIYPGQLVGEISLLIDQPRTASVKSLRDSILLKLTKTVFDQFTTKHPEAMISIARKCVKRLIEQHVPSAPGTNTCNIVFVPAGEKHPDSQTFINTCFEILEKSALAIKINSKICDQLLRQGISQSTFDSEDNERLVSWLHQQEANYQYVLYETDPTLTPWTTRCLRHADRIILFGNANSSPDLNPIEKEIKQLAITNHVYTEIVLFQSETPFKNTGDWLKRRPFLQSHHHILNDSLKDFERFIRYISGRSLGLVLSGGGAKGFAYIGVWRALQELNIPIDFVAGASMGSLIAGGIAKHISWTEMIAIAEKALLKLKSNYTIPILSISTSKSVTDFIRDEIFEDDLYIEDLPVRFVCTSTDLSNYCTHVHENGLLWKAVRASVSLPGIFPPVTGSQNEILVDGGLLNNFPVDLMRERISGGKIIAVNCNYISETKKFFPIDDPCISGWKYYKTKKHYANREDVTVPSIAEIIILSSTIGGLKHEALMKKLTDYFFSIDLKGVQLLDRKNWKKTIEDGYIASMKYFSGIIDEIV